MPVAVKKHLLGPAFPDKKGRLRSVAPPSISDKEKERRGSETRAEIASFQFICTAQTDRSRCFVRSAHLDPDKLEAGRQLTNLDEHGKRKKCKKKSKGQVYKVPLAIASQFVWMERKY